MTTFVLLGLAGLSLATVSVREPARVEGVRAALLSVASPPAELGAWAARVGGDLVGGVTEQRHALAELAETRERLRAARVELLERDELASENERLRDLLGLRDRVTRQSVSARVLRLELAPDRVLTIDRGADDGVAVDQSVVAPDGVVGKVIAVSGSVAQVQCLTDPDAGVAVLVGPRRRAVHAIVKDAEGETVRLRYVDPLAVVEVGDAVVTSGLDQVHPKGLPVGAVVAVEPGAGVEREVSVRPAVDPRQVEEVLVLVGGERAASDLTLASLRDPADGRGSAGGTP